MPWQYRDPFHPICHYMDIQNFFFLADRLGRQIGFGRFNIQMGMEVVVGEERAEFCGFRNLIICAKTRLIRANPSNCLDKS